jgi:hypothetical protein
MDGWVGCIRVVGGGILRNNCMERSYWECFLLGANFRAAYPSLTAITAMLKSYLTKRRE